MFIIDIEYQAPLEEIDQNLVAHRDFLASYYQKGLLLASGPKNPRTGGFLIALGSDRQAVEKMIQEDPFFQKSLAGYTITEFSPVKHHADIAHLLNF